MITTIIFDNGGVFLPSYQRTRGKFIHEIAHIPLEKAEQLWEEYARPKLLLGLISPKEFLIELKNNYSLSHPVDELLKRWNNFYSIPSEEHINWELVKLAQKLERNYKLYMLTDTIDIQDNQVSNNIHPLFKKVFTSFGEHLSKKDPEAFKNVLIKIHATPQECIFIDDMERNVQTANSLGIQGILFTNTPQLKKDLKKISILF